MKLVMVRLLDLSNDLLQQIVYHVIVQDREGGTNVTTEESFRLSLPIALTCRTLYSVWKRSIRQVEIWLSGKLDDRGLLSLCRNSGSVMRRLVLRKCTRLSRTAINMVPSFCALLRSLDLSHLDAVDDTTVTAIAILTSDTLFFLALNGCVNVTQNGLYCITEHCTSLRHLDMGGIPAVDDDVVCKVSHSLGPVLRTLILSSCELVTDASMHELGHFCTSLMSLTMRSLPHLTDYGLADLCAGAGAHLHVLDIIGCNVSFHGYINTMQSHCPRIYRRLVECNYEEYIRSLRDHIISTLPMLIYRVKATDAVRRRPALYFLLLDESSLRPFRVSVLSKSVNLSHFGFVLCSNFGREPSDRTRMILKERFGYDVPHDGG